MDKKFVHVENLCISVCKTLCILHAKLCAFFTSIVTICVFLMFPTKFSHLSHRLFHSHTTPVNKQSEIMKIQLLSAAKIVLATFFIDS